MFLNLFTKLGMRLHPRLAGILASLLAVVIWGVSPAIVKTPAQQLPLAYFLLLRYGMSTILFFPIFSRSLFSRILEERRSFLLLSISIFVHLSFQIISLRYLSVSWYVVLFALAPLISMLILGQKITGMTAFFFILATLGSWLFLDSDSLNFESWLGIGSLILSIIAWGFLTKGIKGTQKRVNDLEMTALCNLIAFIAYLGLWLMMELPVSPLNRSSLLAIGFLSVSVPVGFALFSFALRQATIFALFSQYFEPVVGVISGYLIFNETLSSRQFLGSSLIIGASGFLVHWQNRGSASSKPKVYSPKEA